MNTPDQRIPAKWSPLWLESVLEKRVLSRSAPVPGDRGILSAWAWVAGLALVGVWLFLPPWREPALLDFGGNVHVVSLALGLALLLGKFRESEISRESREVFCVFLCAFTYSLLAVNFRALPEPRAIRWLIEFAAPLAYFLWREPSGFAPLKIGVGYVLLAAIPLSSGFYSFRVLGFNGFRFVDVRYLMPVMLPLIAWLAVQSKRGWKEWGRAAVIWLAPAQLISKTALLPDFIKPAPGGGSRTLGLFWTGVGVFHLAAMLYLFPDFTGVESRAPEGILDFLNLGFLSYLRFYLFVYGASALTRATFYFAGWETPAFFNYALLSVSPQERWRRWDIPVYLTYRLFVFLPVFRKTGSVGFGILLTFMAVAASYTFQPLFHVWGPRPDQAWFNIAKIFAFYGAQGFFVYVGIVLQSRWPRADRLSGWLGVLVTTFFMSVCYGLRHLPLEWLRPM